MVFNFAQRRKRKKAARTTSLAPSPEGEGCGTHCVPSRSDRIGTVEVAGAPVAFGPVYASLSDMEVGGRGILGEFDMPEHVAEQLMNLGFLPGLEVTVAQSGPGGDPRVYRVDGVEVALRGELAKFIAVAPAAQTAAIVKKRAKRPTLRSAKDGAPVDGFAANGTPGRRPGATQAKAPGTVGLSTQEASAD